MNRVRSRDFLYFAGGFGCTFIVAVMVVVSSRELDSRKSAVQIRPPSGGSSTEIEGGQTRFPRHDSPSNRDHVDDLRTSNGMSFALARLDDGTRVLGVPASFWNAAPLHGVRFNANSGTPTIDGNVKQTLKLSDDEVGQIESLSSGVARKVAALMMPEPFDEGLAEDESGFLIPPVGQAGAIRDDYAREIRGLLGDERGYMFMAITKRAWTYSLADFGTVLQKVVIKRGGENQDMVMMTRYFLDPATGAEVIRSVSSSSIIPWYLMELSKQNYD